MSTRGFALALHGGAGLIPKDLDPKRREQVLAALTRILTAARERLAAGAPALDAVEATVVDLEEEPLFNAGKGAVFDARGTHMLEASIMDGATRGCGAVTGLTTVRNPIRLARLVMERTRHVFLQGAGAEEFAGAQGVERVENSWFDTPHRRAQWEAWRAAGTPSPVGPQAGTVGCVARDSAGHLAAATSTGGLTGKMPGRIGDSPLIGCGTYADDATCAVSCTGTGEQLIRHTVARTVAARIEYLRESLEAATGHLVREVLRPADGGLIAVDREGGIAMPFNSQGMYRAACDGGGRFEVAIW